MRWQCKLALKPQGGSFEQVIRDWEIEDRKPVAQERKTVADAWTEFLADIEARKLHDSTAGKYKLLKRQMEDFAQRRGLHFLDEFDLATVSRFRSEWTQGPRTSLKKLERLRAFFRFAQKRKWVAENPASELKAPKITLRPTLPFTQEEMMRTLAAVDKYKATTSANGMENARRLLGLLLLLRYSGMRISDAVQVTADRIAGRRLFLYMQKTGEPVNVILPDFVLKALEETPRVTDRHFFWSGQGNSTASCGAGKRGSAVSSDSRRFQTAIRTDCATRSPWNCFSPVCQLSV